MTKKQAISSFLVLLMVILLVAAITTFVHASRKDKHSRVAGGTDLEQDNEFPHLVSLQYGRNGGTPQHFCVSTN